MTKDEFYSKWLETFALNIPRNKIKKYVESTGNYIWHIFSWELLSENQYLLGNEAKEAYDNIDKNGAIYIKWFEDNHTKDITQDFISANDLDNFVEVYVVGKDFEWTYIKTHESTCGPYFMKNK